MGRNVQTRIREMRTILGWDVEGNGSNHPRRRAIAFLAKGVKDRYKKAGNFAVAIQDVLFEPNPGDLAHDDRQRCLVTILATRKEQFPLALHTFIAILEGVKVRELQNIFFLVGVYTGIPGMVNGIDVLKRILEVTDEELPDRFAPDPMKARNEAQTAQDRILGRLLMQFSVSEPVLMLLRELAAQPQRSRKPNEVTQLFTTILTKNPQISEYLGFGSSGSSTPR